MRQERTIGIVLITASWLKEVHSLFWYLWPAWSKEIVLHPCFDKSIDVPTSHEWMLIYIFDCIYLIALCFCAEMSTRRPTYNIRMIFLIHFIYNILDFLALAWNNKKNDLHYAILLIICTATIIFIIFPFHKKRGKIVQL